MLLSCCSADCGDPLRNGSGLELISCFKSGDCAALRRTSRRESPRGPGASCPSTLRRAPGPEWGDPSAKQMAHRDSGDSCGADGASRSSCHSSGGSRDDENHAAPVCGRIADMGKDSIRIVREGRLLRQMNYSFHRNFGGLRRRPHRGRLPRRRRQCNSRLLSLRRRLLR